MDTEVLNSACPQTRLGKSGITAETSRHRCHAVPCRPRRVSPESPPCPPAWPGRSAWQPLRLSPAPSPLWIGFFSNPGDDPSMPNNRRKLITVALLAFAALVARVLVFPHREFVWQGRTLGAWLQESDADTPESRPSADAIRQIGMNTIPLIIQGLHCPDLQPPSMILAFKLRQL